MPNASLDGTLAWWEASLPMARGWRKIIFKVLSNSNHPGILHCNNHVLWFCICRQLIDPCALRLTAVTSALQNKWLLKSLIVWKQLIRESTPLSAVSQPSSSQHSCWYSLMIELRFFFFLMKKYKIKYTSVEAWNRLILLTSRICRGGPCGEVCGRDKEQFLRVTAFDNGL